MCSVDGCARRVAAKGLCLMHYKRWRKHGDPGPPEPRPKTVTVCVVEGCGRGGKLVRGMCCMHYGRWQRHGTTERQATEPGSVRVEEVVYRGITFRRYPDATQKTHRLYYKPGGADAAQGIEALHREVWKDANGPIPPGHHVHHVDEDPSNNDPSNLVALPHGEHTTHHTKGVPVGQAQRAHLDRARERATEWHRSEDGRAWHRAHAARTGFGRR